jgi:hypothetical protein
LNEERFWKAAAFSSNGLHYLEKRVTLATAMLILIASALILSFPTDFTTKSIIQSAFAFVFAFAGLAAITLIAFAFCRLLGSKAVFKEFFVTTTGAFASSLLLVSLPLGILGIIVFNWLLGDPRLGALLFSIVPYYNYVVFGWACEAKSGLKRFKGILAGLFGASLMLGLYLLLGATIGTLA